MIDLIDVSKSYGPGLPAVNLSLIHIYSGGYQVYNCTGRVHQSGEGSWTN